MFKDIKKTPKRLHPLDVDGNYFKNILCQYHKPKRGFWQWLM